MTTHDEGEHRRGEGAILRKAMMGEELIIARDKKPVLKLVPIESPAKSRKSGTAKGRVWTSPDFDATPADFSDYA